MIIYSFEHFSAFFQMLTLRLTKHRNEKAIFIYLADQDSLNIKSEIFDKLKNTGLFDHVLSLPEIPLKNLTESETIEQVISTYTPILQQNNVNLDEVTFGYEYWDWFASFAFFMDYHNIPFTIIEPFPNHVEGMYTKPERMVKKRFISQEYGNLLSKICKIGENNKPIGNVMIFPETDFFDDKQLDEHEKQFIETFDFYSQFNLVAEEDKQKIMACFDVDVPFLQNNSVSILLPNSFGFTGLFSAKAKYPIKDRLYTADKYPMLYTTLVDYFAKPQNKIMYHPHPNRERSILNATVLLERGMKHMDSNMPVEFLHWVPNFRINQTLALKTTSIAKLKSIIDEDISFDGTFTKVFTIMDRLFTIQKIISNFMHPNLKFYGIPDKTFEMLYKCNFDNYPAKNFMPLTTCQDLQLQHNDVCIINTTLTETEPMANPSYIADLLENADENSIIFFTDFFHETAFFPQAETQKFLLDFIVPIEINRVRLDNGPLIGELGTVVIYAFCKNPETRQKIAQTTFTKTLKYLNVTLIIEPTVDSAKYMQQSENFAILTAVIAILNRKSRILFKKELTDKFNETKATLNEKIKSLTTAGQQKDDKIKSLSTVIQQKDDKIKTLTATLQQKDKQIKELTAVSKNHEVKIKQQAAEILEKNTTISEDIFIINQKQNRIVNLVCEVDELHLSTSWRITAPLRKLKRLFTSKK
ncbi:MAG: coiled-coil domain-containing protein 22 [Firmicutes bacterium]|nr:coiled-coil domain-containing protein 22 [Bacillota bacterium]